MFSSDIGTSFMIRLPFVRYNPIGIDIGSKSIKMVQFTKNYDAIQEAAIVDLPPELSPESDFEGYLNGLGQTLQRSRVGRHFRGNDAIVCVHQRDLFLHNIRVGKAILRHSQISFTKRPPTEYRTRCWMLRSGSLNPKTFAREINFLEK